MSVQGGIHIPNDLAKTLDGYTDGSNFQTQISVITLDDNLSHPYFQDMQINKDNVNPIGNAVLTTLYTSDILNYWATYTGIVVVSVRMLDSNKDNTNSQDYFEKTIKPEFNRYKELLKYKEEQRKLKNNITSKSNNQKDKKKKEKNIKQVLQNDYYNYSFIGRVSRFKQRGEKYILYLEDLGWKFMQKVPMEFRKAFVAGQYLDDAFQAICEFMGVEFAYSIEDLHEYTFGADGYSIQKDGKTIEDVPQILREWANGKEDKKDEEEIYDATGSNTGLDEYNKKNKSSSNSSNSNKTGSNKNNDNKNPSNTTGTDSNNKSDAEKDKESLAEKKAQYQEEFDEKIRNLFIGNTFYESDLCNPILNYDNITIEPKAANDSSNMSTTGNNNNNNNSNSLPKTEEEAKKYWGEQTRKADIGLDVKFK